MAISVEIVPSSEALTMYGEADPTYAYSLSGHVTISVSCARTTRILLESLTLTFEGQTEIFTPQTGYASARLCSITQEITAADGFELTNEWSGDGAKPCMWNIVFNLTIPGWLPETSTFGDDLGIRYTLYADAKFSYFDDRKRSPWALLCSSLCSRMRSVETEKPILIIRQPSRGEDATDVPSSYRTFLVTPPILASSESSEPRIPVEILEKIKILVSVPIHVNTDDGDFSVTIRMRTKDLDDSDCGRIQIKSMTSDILQMESFRTQPTDEYINRNLLPTRTQQPPNLALRCAHPCSVYSIGLYGHGKGGTASRSFSVLPPGESRPHFLGEDNYPFCKDNDENSPPTWYTLETRIPFLRESCERSVINWAGYPTLRPSISSPLITVHHEVWIRLLCSYDLPEPGARVDEQLGFVVPLTFARPPMEMPSCGLPPSQGQQLPAYSQLFDNDGNRKFDHSVPLPLYTPRNPKNPKPSSNIQFSESTLLMEPPNCTC